MLRALGLGLATAIVLISGPAAREPLTKEEYVVFVRAVVDESQVDRLFEDVVNSNYSRPFEVCRECRQWSKSDIRTAVGRAWLSSERDLQWELKTVAERLDGVRPPADVAQLHPVWISAIRGCAEGLRRIETDLRLFRPVGQWPERASTLAFEEKVAREADRHCFHRFAEIIPAFNEKGYEFGDDQPTDSRSSSRS